MAAAALEETLRIAPHHAEAINAAGVVQYRAGNLPQALQLYQRAAVLSPRGSQVSESYTRPTMMALLQVYSNLAAALMDARRLREAAAAALYSVQLNPSFAAGYVNLGVMLKVPQHSNA
jgi:tetratricopeptide (TPR) repeat protein